MRRKARSLCRSRRRSLKRFIGEEPPPSLPPSVKFPMGEGWVGAPNYSMPLIEINGLKLYYKIEGASNPAASVILFLHGLGSSSSDWALQSHFFSQNYRVLLVDLRG